MNNFVFDKQSFVKWVERAIKSKWMFDFGEDIEKCAEQVEDNQVAFPKARKQPIKYRIFFNTSVPRQL